MKKGGSYWDPGNYKKITNRIEDGYIFCGELMSMLEERGEIEKNYAKSLENWAKKWDGILDRGDEGGTACRAYRGLCGEARSLAALHSTRKEELVRDVVQNVKMWQKVNYKKGIISIKEKKNLEDTFKKVQQPWADTFDKLKKAQKAYYEACSVERDTEEFRRNTSMMTSLSNEQLKKIESKLAKSKQEVSKWRGAYENCVKELNALTPRYMDQMKILFSKCQSKERQRLEFFKEVLMQIHKVLDYNSHNSLTKIYTELSACMHQMDPLADLRWWSQCHGVDTPANWPKFEEYNDSLASLTKSTTVIKSIPRSSVPVESASTIACCSTTSVVKVKALYDYQGSARDELSLRKGEEFEMIEEEDDLGWCKGRKNGQIGLYPAKYAAPLYK